MSDYDRPLPTPSRLSRPYWDGLRAHTLVLQRCADCHTVRHYPRPVCDRCYSMRADYVEVGGSGRIHSWTVNHHAFHPAYKRDLPYVTLTVDLDAGVRMQAPLRDAGERALAPGLAVELGFEDVTPQLTLPCFRLVE